ncbi:hypothetical protein CEXT_460821 [Caerostris extrusa]|uniref:Uncharacterized protein n=1 Tax=Caerostris extrusa TaxID=172846 RepID=A0AAV4TJL6_CAEEX|nr:hypothetical protein CEXT_460821 [Caerostris extrusa]
MKPLNIIKGYPLNTTANDCFLEDSRLLFYDHVHRKEERVLKRTHIEGLSSIFRAKHNESDLLSPLRNSEKTVDGFHNEPAKILFCILFKLQRNTSIAC